MEAVDVTMQLPGAYSICSREIKTIERSFSMGDKKRVCCVPGYTMQWKSRPWPGRNEALNQPLRKRFHRITCNRHRLVEINISDQINERIREDKWLHEYCERRQFMYVFLLDVSILFYFIYVRGAGYTVIDIGELFRWVVNTGWPINLEHAIPLIFQNFQTIIAY